MAKGKAVSAFFCQNCGYESSKWMGQCPACHEWNSFVEERITKSAVSSGGSGRSTNPANVRPVELSEVTGQKEDRFATGIEEFDRVLGLKLLRAIHLNDSMMPFASKKDRHATIGDGEIGFDALLHVLTHEKLRHLPFYLETPLDDAGHKEEIAKIRKNIES